MDKSTQKILVIGGLGLVAWYLWSKKKTSETTTGGQSKSVPFEKDAFGMPMVRNDLDKIGGVSKKPYMPTVTDRDVQILVDEMKNRKAPQTIPTPTKEPSIKPPTGRYRFKEDRSDSRPIGEIYNVTTSTGAPKSQQIQTVTYKKGDVVNVQKFFWNISSGDYSVILTIAGLTYSYPLASLEKVDDTTPINAPQITKKAAGGMAYFAGKRPLTIDNLLM